MGPDIDLSDCNNCLCLASRRAARGITRAFDRKLRASGIRATQFTILVMLARAGPLSIGQLAKALGVERTTLTRNLAPIEAKHWAKSGGGDDARSRIVAITGKGRTALEAALPAWREAQAAAAAAIGQPGINALHTLARRAIG
jgi:DNA-binding MarR family transcriptional regulator